MLQWVSSFLGGAVLRCSAAKGGSAQRYLALVRVRGWRCGRWTGDGCGGRQVEREGDGRKVFKHACACAHACWRSACLGDLLCWTHTHTLFLMLILLFFDALVLAGLHAFILFCFFVFVCVFSANSCVNHAHELGYSQLVRGVWSLSSRFLTPSIVSPAGESHNVVPAGFTPPPLPTRVNVHVFGLLCLSSCLTLGGDGASDARSHTACISGRVREPTSAAGRQPHARHRCGASGAARTPDTSTSIPTL